MATKRIVCGGCVPWWYEQKKKVYFPREFIYIKHGKALDQYICDSCGTPIAHGEKCHAVSITTEEMEKDHRRYWPWESDYIAIEDKKDQTR